MTINFLTPLNFNINFKTPLPKSSHSTDMHIWQRKKQAENNRQFPLALQQSPAKHDQSQGVPQPINIFKIERTVPVYNSTEETT